MPRTPANGKICYIELPATDIARSSDFYKRIFGWNIRTRGVTALTRFHTPSAAMASRVSGHTVDHDCRKQSPGFAPRGRAARVTQVPLTCLSGVVKGSPAIAPCANVPSEDPFIEVRRTRNIGGGQLDVAKSCRWWGSGASGVLQVVCHSSRNQEIFPS